ncbi:DUF6879 family protein [Actinokineospora globicatena]|uniref:DUF6879 family protein n=1 Tax=Actinokineospora globicatena TaxID=103729 RepID=UPI0020A2E84C|nr:DUF6879 family protein [Actinokineospora globicatena]MCP2302802.1 hypothetical protein [Actinokineospora globicatena]GLW78816.1 hypothetical protein Aglo01_32980 [Actinokineospora globicatena]GLW84517.1 hypothetical protein Aglo02_21570 [Actinokineospora globicatena]
MRDSSVISRLATAEGTRLLGDAYLDDFNERFWRIGRSGFWKLERLQDFREPTDDSWVAFDQGRWQDAVAALRERRGALTEHYRKISEHGFETWRVRVVEWPLTDYLRWESELLALRDELGGHTRFLDASRVEHLESAGVLPELITLGDEALYHLLYDETGLQQGGVRYDDEGLVVAVREFIQGLYSVGATAEGFMERAAAEQRSTLPHG